MKANGGDSGTNASANSFNLQIGLYSLAAAATGVSLLALAPPAAGEVVVTRRTIEIPVSTADIVHPVKISMANDGIVNFNFDLVSLPPTYGRGFSVRELNLWPASDDASPVMAGNFRSYTPALPRGARIGPSAAFGAIVVEVENTYAGSTFRGTQGYWGGNPKDHYVGVRFRISGQFHYGWIRLTVTTSTDPHGPAMTAKITGYAYETDPNKLILAGTAAVGASADKPAAAVQLPHNIQIQSAPSLGMLAAGADALPIWRREKLDLR